MGAPSLNYLLSLGPYGALLWGAYLLGKGGKVTIQVELSDHDRELIEKLGKGSACLPGLPSYLFGTSAQRHAVHC